ncbi:hypothetical protein ACFXTH_001392 [Malus domestica]
MLFQDPSSFVHQHLAPSVRNDMKSYVGFLSFFHLTTVKTSQLSTMNMHNPRSYSICNQGFQRDQNLQMHRDFSDVISSANFQTSAKLHVLSPASYLPSLQFYLFKLMVSESLFCKPYRISASESLTIKR